MKIARLIPLFKSCDNSLFTNYRPPLQNFSRNSWDWDFPGIIPWNSWKVFSRLFAPSIPKSLVLSKLDYCESAHYPLPEFQLKRLQRVQLVAASFVLNRYVNDINDIVKIGWLPVRQRRDFHVLKLVHQALYSPSWPSYVPLDTVKHLRSLRSGAATRLIIPMETGTF